MATAEAVANAVDTAFGLFPFFEEVCMMLLCVVRDRLADAIGPVMVFPAVPAAIRSYSDLALDPSTLVARHPGDFDLLQVGEIDQGSGEITPLVPPLLLLTGVAWLAAQKPDKGDGQLSLLKEA